MKSTYHKNGSDFSLNSFQPYLKFSSSGRVLSTSPDSHTTLFSAGINQQQQSSKRPLPASYRRHRNVSSRPHATSAGCCSTRRTPQVDVTACGRIPPGVGFDHVVSRRNRANVISRRPAAVATHRNRCYVY